MNETTGGIAGQSKRQFHPKSHDEPLFFNFGKFNFRQDDLTGLENGSCPNSRLYGQVTRVSISDSQKPTSGSLDAQTGIPKPLATFRY